MSSSELAMGTRRAYLVAIASVALAGCGFQPLYGQDQSGAGAPAPRELASVAVLPVEAAPLDRRLGQVLRNELQNLVNPRGAAAEPLYDLGIRLATDREALAIAADDTITRYNVILDAAVLLTERASGKPIYETSMRAVGSFDVQVSDYGTLIAERATREDAARDLARRLTALLGTVLAQRET
jgi:LPS-assembly lipoprotein